MANYYLTGIDDDTWKHFKACCDLEGTTIRQALLRYIDIRVSASREHLNYHKQPPNKHKKGGKTK